jgi:hypothetical protein
MTVVELGGILKDMYEKATDKDHVAMIHLFGIKYSDEIISNGYTAKEIVKAAGMNESYATEISKGIRLGKYVSVK